MSQNKNDTNKRLDISDYLTDLVDLKKGVDQKGTIREIQEKKSMDGANAWMLMCSIIIASIGLNTNSQAVIIGAMLISPLMSPILGIGLGVAINSNRTIKSSVANFGIAALIAIVTSTLFFMFSPLKEFNPQILARTQPTFLDVLIAIFGGVAGIISIARKDISTTLPGVAIATALMPPLCVTGFGIANSMPSVMLTSFYLFFLNSFFVAFATYIIIKFMGFPAKKFTDPKERKRNIIFVTIFSILMILPSLFIFRNVLKEEILERRIETFKAESLGDDAIYLDEDQIIEMEDGSKKLILKVYGNAINKSSIPKFNADLKKLGIRNTTVEILPTSEIDLTKIINIESELTEVKGIADQLDIVLAEGQKQKELLEYYESNKSQLLLDSIQFQEICDELQILFPDIDQISIGNTMTNLDTVQMKIPTLILEWQKKNSKKTNDLNGQKILKFLKKRLDADTIKFLSY